MLWGVLGSVSVRRAAVAVASKLLGRGAGVSGSIFCVYGTARPYRERNGWPENEHSARIKYAAPFDELPLVR